MRLRPWQLSLIALAVCALALLGTYNYRAAKTAGHAWIFRRLPTDHAVIAGIDVEALRQSALLDLLAGTRSTGQLNYRQLMDEMGFDYRTDLDYVAASIPLGSGERHYILNGRFDWKTWFAAAPKFGGRCQNTFCEVPGLATMGTASFLPLATDTLGLSVSQASQAAWTLSADTAGVPLPSIPSYPMFLAMDASVLTANENLPIAIQPFTQILSTADYVVLGVQQNESGTFDLVLDAECLSEARATTIQSQMREAANAESAFHDLFWSGMVHTKGRSLHGRWPLDRPTLEAIANR